MNQRTPEATALLRAGTRTLQAGDHYKAADILEEALEQAPNDFDILLNLSAAYIVGKKFKQAVPLLEQLSQREPKNGMIWTNLGAAYLGNPVLASEESQDKAIKAFKRALALNPKAPNCAYNIALIYKDRKQFKIAANWFERAIEANPNDADAKSWLERLRGLEEAK